MVIQSLIERGPAWRGLPDAMKQNPVNERCGGRIALPAILLAAAWRGSHSLPPKIRIALILGGIELILAFDRYWGFHNTPVFREASRLLQRHITTAQPGIIETYTACQAIQALIDAHEKGV